MKAKYSEFDFKGRLFVDCVECKSGSKGDKSCSSGSRVKKGNVGGCFIGKLHEHLELPDK